MTQITLATADQLEEVARRAAEAALAAVRREYTLTPIPQWVTAKKAAELAGVTQRTIRNRAERGELETKSEGGKLLYRTPEGGW